ncbi:hypothetical protein [Benzoatithermus flavus]|uniref:Guanylate cyclase domain-containing protein n=1 Tax=Benzoatithermus flavus TaxID=3108223 RepID=A0ABU8XVI2_9PROT
MRASAVQRRLAAILAADVVGYSRLMERDEAGTLARLRAHRQAFLEPLVAAHQGRVVKLMGDGALVEFPSAVEAVACAVALQAGIAERERDVPEQDKIRFRECDAVAAWDSRPGLLRASGVRGGHRGS